MVSTTRTNTSRATCAVEAVRVGEFWREPLVQEMIRRGRLKLGPCPAVVGRATDRVLWFDQLVVATVRALPEAVVGLLLLEGVDEHWD